MPDLAEPKTNTTNGAPRTKWFKAGLACGTERHRLYKNGAETPYFIDVAHTIGHRSQGQKVGIYAAGSGTEITRRDGSSYRIAAFMGGFDRISVAKARAEQMALS